MVPLRTPWSSLSYHSHPFLENWTRPHFSALATYLHIKPKSHLMPNKHHKSCLDQAAIFSNVIGCICKVLVTAINARQLRPADDGLSSASMENEREGPSLLARALGGTLACHWAWVELTSSHNHGKSQILYWHTTAERQGRY